MLVAKSHSQSTYIGTASDYKSIQSEDTDHGGYFEPILELLITRHIGWLVGCLLLCIVLYNLAFTVK